MCLSLFLLSLKPVSDLSVIFSNLFSFCLFIFRKHMAFPWPSLEFHDFPGLEIEIINSTTFQVFHDLYEPCYNVNWNSHIFPGRVLDYPAVLSPFASDRSITPGCFEQHSLSPWKQYYHKNEHVPPFKWKLEGFHTRVMDNHQKLEKN